MEKEFAVVLGGERIGTAKVVKEGLYYRIRCLCTVSGSVPLKIIASGSENVDMGLCVPMGDKFGLETRIPVKRIGEGELHFSARPRHRQTGEFMQVLPDEPFRYIDRLKDAYFEIRGSKAGIVWKDQREMSKPTGQWSEP